MSDPYKSPVGWTQVGNTEIELTEESSSNYTTGSNDFFLSILLVATSFPFASKS